MMKMRNLPVLLVLGSVAVLPACSMFGDHGGGQATYTIPQPPGVSAATIQHVQTKLQQEGDYNGAIDGIWGPSTVDGVRAYQQHHNLPVTGQLDMATMSAMNDSATSMPDPNAPTQPMPTQPTPNNPPAPKTP
jgi:peptidoglycan hydrolase-like protein with peptidoglycan-binding domain